LDWLNFIYFSVAIVADWIISMLRFLEKRSPCLVDILENKIIYIYLSTEKIDLNKMSDVRLFIKWNYFVHLIIYFWQCDYVKYYIEIVEFDLKSIPPILGFNLIWISSFFFNTPWNLLIQVLSLLFYIWIPFCWHGIPYLMNGQNLS